MEVLALAGPTGMTYIEDWEFRNDTTDFLVECVLSKLDLSHVDCKG
jgi:hypothetical protein